MIKFDNNDISYLAVELPDEIKFYKYSGDFAGEISAIDRYLEKDPFHGLRVRLEIERVIAVGMTEDYTEDFDGLLGEVRTHYPACGEKQLREIIGMGQVDYIRKNGKQYFQDAACSNICKCHSTYLRRISNPAYMPAPNGGILSDTIKIMKEKGYRAFRFTVEESIEVKEKYGREDERIRVHLPYPAVCKSQPQSEIKLISCSHKDFFISDAAHRTICIDAPYRRGDRFSVRFSYVNRAVYTDIDSGRADINQPDFFTDELYPHIRFTPLIKDLAHSIAGNEKNPLKLARRVYDWVTEHVKYSYMRDYLYLDNIPEFAVMNGRGDCGVMAVTFITLCRCLGIPAKFESGCAVEPDDIGSHDWAMFYAAPYGWLYCDPSYGGSALSRGDTAAWNHYFGNLDPFRMVANTEFQQSFNPPKRFMRNDPYDNQVGEAEFESTGLGYGEYTRSRHVLDAMEI